MGINWLYLEIEHFTVCGGLFFSEKFSEILGKLKQKGFYNKLDLSNLMTYLLHLLFHKELKCQSASSDSAEYLWAYLDVPGQPRQAVSTLMEAAKDGVGMRYGTSLTCLEYFYLVFKF